MNLKKNLLRFIACSFILTISSFLYINIVTNKTKLLKNLRDIESIKKVEFIQLLEIQDKYIKAYDLPKIESRAKKELKMKYPKEVFYFFKNK